MKLLLTFLFLFSLSSQLMAADCLNQKDEMKQKWARVDGRTQSGGWLFFTGKAAGASPEKAYFKAEGLALTRLVQECRLIHKKTRIIERCDEKVGTSYLAYVRANITVKECELSQNSEPSTNKKFTEIYNEYDRQQKIERMVNNKGGSSKLTSLQNKLNQLLKEKRTSDIQKEIEKKKREMNLLETSSKRKSHRCKDSIDCLIKGNEFLKQGKTTRASWTYYDGCYTYKDPELCYSYGTYIKNGGKTKTRKYSVYNAFKEACSRNHAEACHDLGYWERLEFKNKKIDSKLSFKLSCDLGYHKGCSERGKIDWGKFLKSDDQKGYRVGMKYFRKACMELADKTSCSFAYQKSARFGYFRKKKMNKKNFAAKEKFLRELLDHGCYTKKDLKSCHEIPQLLGGVTHKFNNKTKTRWRIYSKEFEKTVQIYKKNCDDGYYQSCGTYAFYLRDYFKKEKESAKLYEKTCFKYEEAFFCRTFADYLQKKNKHNEALRFFQKSCELKNDQACHRWGDHLEFYLKKPEEAVAIYRIACERGERTSCGRYGFYIAEKLNDPTKGIEIIKKGCYYKNTDPKRNKINWNSSEACVYRAKIEIEKYKKIQQYKSVIKYHCNEKNLVEHAKKIACDLFDEISN